MKAQKELFTLYKALDEPSRQLLLKLGRAMVSESQPSAQVAQPLLRLVPGAGILHALKDRIDQPIESTPLRTLREPVSG